eukprot:1158258-Pelagomonas_calceolata.AAC.5
MGRQLKPTWLTRLTGKMRIVWRINMELSKLTYRPSSCGLPVHIVVPWLCAVRVGGEVPCAKGAGSVG